ncbi:MAG TPA: saccharopine dehydrogenase NADP-binding domain-containing protein [Planococcus sp. (in: firmicutes)]|nr:saccharopine dehydrogenase NADP-binding domain-containing protein [Planococcus sp. (in: firmicutes)]
MNKKWMIYGANGYTGELIAREAVRRGLDPVLSGRNVERFSALAEELGLEARPFSLDERAADNLADIYLVLHCAGPFQKTSSPMVSACLEAGAHYLDITGEIAVFEHTHAQHNRAKNAGVVLCSGVGFDVIPTDCAALKLKELMPDATHLALGFDSDSGVSPGTYKTMIEGLGSGSAVRSGGALIPVPLGSQQRKIDFGRGTRTATAIPWGDVSTAFYTTGIPNITVWIPMPKLMIFGSRLLGVIRPIVSSNFFRRTLKYWIKRKITGPDEASRKRAPAFIWGEARNEAGEVLTVHLQTANVYDLTVYGALETVQRLREGEFQGGSYTPAQLFGSSLVEQLPGSGKFKISH